MQKCSKTPRYLLSVFPLLLLFILKWFRAKKSLDCHPQRKESFFMHKIHTAQQQQLCRDAKGPLLALVEKQHSRHSDFHTNKWQLVLTHCKMGTGLLVVLVCGGMDRGAGKALPGDSPFANHSRLFSCAVDLPSKLRGVGGSGGGGGSEGRGSQCLCCLGHHLCFLIWMFFGDGTVFLLFFLFVQINGEPRDSRWILGELLCCKNNHIPCKRQASHKKSYQITCTDLTLNLFSPLGQNQYYFKKAFFQGSHTYAYKCLLPPS